MRKNLFLTMALALGLTACSNGGLEDPEDWSKQDRGALIGGSGGAILGAAAGSQSGNAGAGALLGGAAGAGAGAIIGNEVDEDDES